MEIPEELIAALETPALALTSLPGVNGVGLGLREENGTFFDELAVRIYVDDATAMPELPTEFFDLPVSIVEFPIEPLFDPDTRRYDRLVGGAQIEALPRNFGTLGAVVRRNDDNTLAGLTCHHVSWSTGTRVFQPDAPPMPIGATPDLTDSLGLVTAFESPISQTIPTPAGGVLWLGRPIDAAVFSLDEAAAQRTFASELADGFGPVERTAAPRVKTFVRKRGSQTGPTGGLIVGLVLAQQWRFVDPPLGHRYAIMRQFEIFFNPPECPDGIFARGGDSGSIVFEAGTRTAVGMLWGGTRKGGIRASMTDITLVEQRLDVSLAWSSP